MIWYHTIWDGYAMFSCFDVKQSDMIDLIWYYYSNTLNYCLGTMGIHFRPSTPWSKMKEPKKNIFLMRNLTMLDLLEVPIFGV